MRGLRSAALAALLAAAPALAQEPPAGADVDIWRQIPLRGVEASDCLEIRSRGHVIRLALADLRVMAVDAGRLLGKDAEARLQRIFEMRAQGMLGRAASWSREGNCIRAPAIRTEDYHVIAELMKMGRASVRGPDAAHDASAIWIRYLVLPKHDPRLAGAADPLPNDRAGVILFHVERGGPDFFITVWWEA